ncbi:MAG: hypothetical protein HQK98_11460 [Nitrospirae bacterium]|nr:hypothetical protein [Nitrospirota bacterium]
MTTNMNRKRGKSAERAVAKRLDGKRIGIMGGQDVEHPLFSIEVKSRKAFVAGDWMSQAVRNCPDGKTPLVVVHVSGQRHNEDMVIMRMGDFEDFLGTRK